MTESETLLDFPDVGSQRVIVKDVTHPPGKIASPRVSLDDAGPNLIEKRDKFLQRASRPGRSLEIVGEPEALLPEQLHVQVLGLVSHVGS